MNNACDNCHKRSGEVVSIEKMPPARHVGINAPWMFEYRMCRWCVGAWNRTRLPGCKKLAVIRD